MKPRGVNSLFSKQSTNVGGKPDSSNPLSGIRLGALASGEPGAADAEKSAISKSRPDKGPKGTSKSSTTAKHSSAVPRRTAPGA